MQQKQKLEISEASTIGEPSECMTYEALEAEKANARALRAQDRRGRAFMFFWTNEEKINALRRWYPQVYRLLLKNYPHIVAAPDDYPPVAINAVNSMLAFHIPVGDYDELRLA